MRSRPTWITAVEAATWIALGECKSADNLRLKVDQRLAEWRPRPDRHSPLFTDVLDDAAVLTNACDTLIEAARGGEIELWGVPKQSKIVGGFQKLGLDILLPSVTINLLHNHLEADDRTPNDWIMARQQTFTHLRVRRSEVEFLISRINAGESSSTLTNGEPEIVPPHRNDKKLSHVKEILRELYNEDTQVCVQGVKEIQRRVRERAKVSVSDTTFKRARKNLRDETR